MSTQEEPFFVKDLKVDKRIIKVIHSMGITQFFPPQAMVFRETGALEKKNVVLAIPTAAGKTIVAEIIMLQSILNRDRKGKCIYTVPLKALASEKERDFKKHWQAEEAGVLAKVVQTSGDFDKKDNQLDEFDIIVSTNEKADSLFRHKPEWLERVTVLVIDELHLVDEETRGATLEVLIAKMRDFIPDLQVVALSATIQNAEELADWLDADLVVSDWRPIVLKEGLLYKNRIFFKPKDEEKLKRFMDPNASLKEVIDAMDKFRIGKLDRKTGKVITKYVDPIHNVVDNVLTRGGQLLYFLESRRRARTQAIKILPVVKPHLGKKEETKLLTYKRKLSKEELIGPNKEIQLGMDLVKTVQGGVAFHHAGLVGDQRTAIEQAFLEGVLQVITATPTLAAGVNLPARTVLIYPLRYKRGSKVPKVPIKKLEYSQMAGRAGRPGSGDPFGEALIITLDEGKFGFYIDKYLRGETEKITSKLNDPEVLKMHVLAFIGDHMEAVHREDVLKFLEKTFWGHQFTDISDLIRNFDKALDFLKQHELVKEEQKDFYLVTPFGKTTVNLYIQPTTAVMIKEMLTKGDALFVSFESRIRLEAEKVRLLNELLEIKGKTTRTPEETGKMKAIIETLVTWRKQELRDKSEDLRMRAEVGLRTALDHVDGIEGVKKVFEEKLRELEQKLLNFESHKIFITNITWLYVLAQTPDSHRKWVGFPELDILKTFKDEYRKELILKPLRGVNFDVVDEILTANQLRFAEEAVLYYLESLKCAKVLSLWIDEKNEQEIQTVLSNVEPGDVRQYVEKHVWLLYSVARIANVLDIKHWNEQVKVLRWRVEAGIKEELVDLIKIRGVGRIRARRLFKAGFKSVNDLASAKKADLIGIKGIGEVLAENIIKEAALRTQKEIEYLQKLEEKKKPVQEELNLSKPKIDKTKTKFTATEMKEMFEFLDVDPNGRHIEEILERFGNEGIETIKAKLNFGYEMGTIYTPKQGYYKLL